MNNNIIYKIISLLVCFFFSSTATASMSVSASNEYGDHIAANVRDGDIQTSWAARGKGVWLQVDLGRIKTLSAIKLAFAEGDKRKSYFDVQFSLDGKSWITLMSKMESSGETKYNEVFPFDTTRARYVRYIGFGNSLTEWNALTKFSTVSSTYVSR